MEALPAAWFWVEGLGVPGNIGKLEKLYFYFEGS